jgi:hypothetical protein
MFLLTRTLVPIAVLLAALAHTLVCPAARIYFADQPAGSLGSIISIAPDGTGQQTLITATNVSDYRGVAWHRPSGRVYFLDNGSAKRIYSMLPDGSDPQEITSVDPLLLGADLEIDEAAGKIYWAESNAGATGNGLIRRANLNGTSVETAVMTDPGVATTPYFIFLDPNAALVYWGVLSTQSGANVFRRATYAGVIDPNFLITTPTRARDIAVDFRTDTAYWCDRQTGSIYKRPLSGGANQTVIGGMNAPHGIALDLEAEKVYWADTGGRGGGPFNTSARRIARCNFDGSEYENLSAPAANSEPWDLALDTTSPTYNEWRARFFSASAPDATPEADPDGDGASNLLEYAMGAHPKKSASLPRLMAAGNGMRFTRRVGSNLAYRVEVSTDLAAWHYNGDGSGQTWTTESAVTPMGPELQTVVIGRGPALAGAPRAFYRVRVASSGAAATSQSVGR